jgi:hypothetical protein
MMDWLPYLCKENYLEELQHVEEELAKENSMPLVRLVSICIGTKRI